MVETIIADARIPSTTEITKLENKFPAFVPADLTEKAKANGASSSSTYKKGNYPLRSFIKSDNCHYKSIYYVKSNGFKDKTLSNYNEFGLRIAFNLQYVPNNTVVNSCKYVKKSAFLKTKSICGMITSVAPVIIFGGKECIWINKKDCEKSRSKNMECITLNLEDKAVPFDKWCHHNNYADAKELNEQCDKILKENCSEEELSLIVPMKMSSENNYRTATPAIITK